MSNEGEPTRRQPWLSGLGARDWPGDDRAYAALLDALTRDRLTTEAVERERLSTARRSQADVLEANQRQARDELAEAQAELRIFRAALEDARARAGSDAAQAAPYDSRVPEQDTFADVLIQYLVRPGYAEVETDEPEPSHYVYRIRVDWDRLRDLAAEHGHSLPA